MSKLALSARKLLVSLNVATVFVKNVSTNFSVPKTANLTHHLISNLPAPFESERW